MKIQIITVGNLKEKYLKQACAEYLKRLTPYARMEIIEVAEEKANDHVHPSQIEQILEKEGKRILRHCSRDVYVIALAIEGQSFTSTAFARKINQLATYGNSHLAFVIGGSYGLSPDILQRADLTLSFSKMTFPHQLIRLFLLEQIYRSFKINRGETYHK
ncbi:MAG: 23S rRNA (pseudouridine(1915)-N(3))-methyltransferase RlmH [Thermoactinomyces sp.]